MKNILLKSFLILCLTGSAQTTVKLNLSNLSVGLFDVQAEYALSDKHGLQLGFGYMHRRNMIFEEAFMETQSAQLESYEENLFENIKLSGFRITPEYKLYTGDDGAKGVYFDVWAKYSFYSLRNSGYAQEYENVWGFDRVGDFVFDANLTNISAGIGIGTQWFIKDIITIDVLWLGVGYNQSIISADLTTEQGDVDWDKWKEDAKSFNDYGTVEYSDIDDGLRAKITPLLPIALRSSISIGIIF